MLAIILRLVTKLLFIYWSLNLIIYQNLAMQIHVSENETGLTNQWLLEKLLSDFPSKNQFSAILSFVFDSFKVIYFY